MQADTPRISQSGAWGLALAAGGLYASVHILNDWLFQGFELSDHINLIYLPSFLRLVNVLVLGLLWGTIGTALGGVLLYFWLQDSLFISILNTLVSAGCAGLSLWLLQILQQRQLSITRLSDLMKLALLNAFMNSMLHHMVWALADPAQLVEPNQVAYMLVGDISGAIVGALVLRWVASRTGIVEFAKQKVANSDPP
jgi:hypothetical protein